MSTTTVVRGGCLCGKSKYSFDLPQQNLPLYLSFCHCSACRHSSGALCASCAVLPQGTSPSYDLITSLAEYESGRGALRYFCPTCGTHMFFYSPSDDVWWLASGTLDKADGVIEARRHIHVQGTGDGGFSDWLPSVSGNDLLVFQEGADDVRRRQSSTSYLDPAQPLQVKSTSDRLHAHCDCGGIDFYIGRPTAQSSNITASWPDVIIPDFTPDAKKPPNEPWWLRGDRKFLAGVCTCDSCRLAVGFEFIEWAFVPTANITLDAEGKEPFPSATRQFGSLKGYRSSKEATRRFCATCGATVCWDGDVRPNLIDVAVGLLHADEGARAEDWLEWWTNRVSYREDGVKRAKAIVEGVEQGLKIWGERSESK